MQLFILSIYGTDDQPGANWGARDILTLEKSLKISYSAIPDQCPTIREDNKLVTPAGKVIGQLFRTEYEFITEPQHL